MTLLALRFFTVLLPAVLLDLVLGDPRWLPHPVRWMGRTISALETPLRRVFPKTPAGERTAGSALVLLMAVLFGGGSALLLKLCGMVSPWLAWGVEVWFSFQLLSARDLQVEAMAVYPPLTSGDLEGARAAVSRIVGRDTSVLDGSGVAKAAVETVAEFYARCRRGFQQVIQQAASLGIQRGAVVAHGGTWMAVLEAYGRPKRPFYQWQPKNCSGFRMEVRENPLELRLLDHLLEPPPAPGVKLRHRLPVGEGRPLLPAHPGLIGRVVLDLRPGPALKVPEVALPQVGDLHRLQLREQNFGRLPAPEHGGDPQGLHRGHVLLLLPGQGLPLRGQGLVSDSNVLFFQIAKRDAVAQ